MTEFNEFKFEVKDIDDGEHINLIDKYKLKYIPTIIVIDDNDNLLNSFIGNTCSEELIQFLKTLI